MSNKSFLNVEYTIYNESTRHSSIVRGSPEGPGWSELLHREGAARPEDDDRLMIEDKDIPLLIEALWRRYKDSVRDYPEMHKEPVARMTLDARDISIDT